MLSKTIHYVKKIIKYFKPKVFDRVNNITKGITTQHFIIPNL